MNYTNVIITFIISFIVLMAIEVGLSKWKTNHVLKLIQMQKYEELEKELNKFSTKILIPRYNVEYLRLNSYLLQKKDAQVEQQFALLMQFRKNKPQQADLLMKIYNFYMEKENKEECKKYLAEIEKLDNKAMYDEAKMMYDIFLDKKANHIDQLLAEAQKAPENIRAPFYYMIAKQYENMDDQETADKYYQLAKKI
ncbi:MAG: hypothetical protein MR210_09150 [Erysipelotrichaceae bacterium]|nr:hypothetical protein [Erysipelotrichaceae bacterium]MDY5252970.1 hypothetical protein [Erysipelotrichaceae bacterium]